MLIQLHMLQNYAPANLNRDDTGSPKDAIFGGLRRGRISSQCLKRSIRKSDAFASAFQEDGLIGTRTKQLPELIRKELETMNLEKKVLEDIMVRVPEIGRESTKGRTENTEQGEDEESVTPEEKIETETKIKQLIFVGKNELRPLAEKLLALYQKEGAKKWSKMKILDITKALGKSLPLSVDIAMFGRMTTSDAFENVQAAVQVAHALSTNALTQEFDYYTAVDDLAGESGAGMIGDIEFNSCTYYKYLNVHWEQLIQNLGGDLTVARKAILALLEAAVTAQPSGKQNSFAAHCLPDLILAEVSKKNLPVSYANAFLKPCWPMGDRTQMDISVEQLAKYMGSVIKTYGLKSARAYAALQDYDLPEAKKLESQGELRAWLADELSR